MHGALSFSVLRQTEDQFKLRLSDEIAKYRCIAMVAKGLPSPPIKY